MKYTNIVNTVAFGTASGAANTGTTLVGIKKGDVLIIDADTSEVLTGAGNTVSNHPNIAIASCIEDGHPIISNKISGRALSEASEYILSAARKIGSTKVSGVPTYSEDETFSFGIVVPTDLRLQAQRQYRKDVSVVSKGGYDAASKIAALISDFSDNNPNIVETFPFIADVVVVGTETAVAGSSLVVSNGSNRFSGTVTGIAVGNMIALDAGGEGDDGSGDEAGGKGGTYKVLEVGADYVVVDRKYWGLTSSGEAASIITAPTSVDITVSPRKAFNKENPVEKYNQPGKPEIALSEEFEGTTITRTTLPEPGVGYGWQIQDLEAAYMGYLGFTDRRDAMRQGYEFQSDLDLKYDTMALAGETAINDTLVYKSFASMGVIIIFSKVAATQRGAVSTILTPWLASGGVTAAW